MFLAFVGQQKPFSLSSTCADIHVDAIYPQVIRLGAALSAG